MLKVEFKLIELVVLEKVLELVVEKFVVLKLPVDTIFEEWPVRVKVVV